MLHHSGDKTEGGVSWYNLNFPELSSTYSYPKMTCRDESRVAVASQIDRMALGQRCGKGDS